MNTKLLRSRILLAVRRFPTDLAIVLGVVGVASLSLLIPVLRKSPLGLLFGLPLVLFLPGYATISALFPEKGEPNIEVGIVVESLPGSDRIDEFERLIFSVWLSVVIVPMTGLVLDQARGGFRVETVVLAVGVYTGVMTVLAAVRRRNVPSNECFRVPFAQWRRSIQVYFWDPGNRTEKVINVTLALALLVAVSSLTYAVAVPKQDETFTEFYLLNEDSAGELQAENYPTTLVQGETTKLVVGITNYEHERTAYTVVVRIQRGEVTENSLNVHEETELYQFHVLLNHNESWTRTHAIKPTMVGDNLRVQYLLFRNEEPSEPRTAYRKLHFWINVTESA
ncbi:DUF1616 domain-containing protein (plasmid) [Halorussus limi]|uniref:DUF1616 domain-containing protein n=1 Tax=Halorussus limi TaxID=2938695 RepID=A0A8U0I163_9EURY|nr:DUF1616 domain-containing protein [Halorussus limi]UPV76646.1 DUF1616 domain-containing protein [Halorussus limi]